MLTRENTKQIKGIAILLMVAHHLLAFPERVPYGTTIQTTFFLSGMELTELIGGFGKICVSIYMFMGGYGLFKRYTSCVEKKVECNRLGKDIIKLYKAYWKVFLIFVPIAFVFFGNQAQYCADIACCTRYDVWKIKDFIQNFFGLSRSYNSEWWFFWSYLMALFQGYVFIELFRNKKNLYSEIAAVIIWIVLLMNVFPLLPFEEGYHILWENTWYNELFLGSEYTPLFFAGIIFAKYDVFASWKVYLSEFKRVERIVLSIVGACFVVYVRQFFLKVDFEIVIVPIFVFICYIFVEETGFLKKPLEFMGEHSTNIWLIHTFFCFYFGTVAKFIYGFNNVVISYIILLALSLGSSMLVNLIWKVIGVGYQRVRAWSM